MNRSIKEIEAVGFELCDLEQKVEFEFVICDGLEQGSVDLDGLLWISSSYLIIEELLDPGPHFCISLIKTLHRCEQLAGQLHLQVLVNLELRLLQWLHVQVLILEAVQAVGHHREHLELLDSLEDADEVIFLDSYSGVEASPAVEGVHVIDLQLPDLDAEVDQIFPIQILLIQRLLGQLEAELAVVADLLVLEDQVELAEVLEVHVIRRELLLFALLAQSVHQILSALQVAHLLTLGTDH